MYLLFKVFMLKYSKMNKNKQPIFDTDGFSIPFLTVHPDGLEFQQRSTLGRTEIATSSVQSLLDDEQRIMLRNGVAREMKFRNVDVVRSARKEWKDAAEHSPDDKDAIEYKRNAFYEARKQYLSTGKKIGLRTMELSGNTLIADTQLVDFPTYELFAGPNNSNEVESFSAATGVAMVVETADKRLIIQHRAIEKINADGKLVRGNANYPDVPGISVGGMVDASVRESDRDPGTPDSLTTDTLKDSILKEAGEELGLAPTQVKNIKIVGLAKDKIKVHDEILFLSTLDMTAEELYNESRHSRRNKNLGDADFEEKFFDIESSPAAIVTLLTEVLCPMPSTHAAALVAAGYAMMLEQFDQSKANLWINGLQEKINSNYTRINNVISDFYKDNPSKIDEIPQRYAQKYYLPKRNLTMYSAAFSPEEQGLPSLESELIRVNLINTSITV